MENIKNIRSITIKSGNKNKSINSYIKKICRVIKLTSANLELIAYGKFYILKKDNNINKLITIIEIIKRYLPELQFSNKVCWAYELNKDISNNSRKGPSQEGKNIQCSNSFEDFIFLISLLLINPNKK